MRSIRFGLTLVLVMVAGTAVTAGSAATADGPGSGQPWIVSLGDSAISGEGGRWAGNTNGPSVTADALGEDAYNDASAAGPITHFTDYCVDIAGGGTANGTEIRLHHCNSTAAQTWIMREDFSVRGLNKCMTVMGSPVNGATVQLWQCLGLPTQRWKRLGNRLLTMASGRCLDVPGANPGPLTKLRVWDCHDGIAGSYQNWSQPVTFEKVAGCHRSRSAPIHIDRSSSATFEDPKVVNTVNFACSGARTYTQAYDPDEDYKPGIDFVPAPPGFSPDHRGQAELLKEFASQNNVQAVALLIGANNMGFSKILERCIKNFLLSFGFFPDHCRDDTDMAARVTSQNFALIKADIKTAITNVRTAMSKAGYQHSAYTIFLHTYWAPLPEGFLFRYPENNGRQTIGGCGVWNVDADWGYREAFQGLNKAIREAAAESGHANVKLVDFAKMTFGHMLCQSGPGLLEEKGLASWLSPGAADVSEWITQARIGPRFDEGEEAYQEQEGGHANYWGQLAMRNCLRLAYNANQTRPGDCRTAPGGGVNIYGEPNMILLPPHPIPLILCESSNKQIFCDVENVGTAPAQSITWRRNGQSRQEFDDQINIIFICTLDKHYDMSVEMSANGITRSDSDDLYCLDEDI